MHVRRCILALLVAAIAMSGRSSGPGREFKLLFENDAKAQLKEGIKDYEDGLLTQASANFQSALDSGLTEGDQVTAHKYLAFIYCATQRERQCRAHFRTALEIDPSFELTPAEAGHPMWGPVFRKAREGRR
jgi:Tfp pilus assembly protein PilF